MQSNPDRPGRRAGDALLEAALSSMPYGFSVWDESYRLILYNRRYLDIYSYPETRVFVGMTLRQLSDLAFEVGNHPGFSAEEIYATYLHRLRSTDDPQKVVRAQKSAHDLVIKTNHIRVPGLGWVITHEDVSDEVALVGLAEERQAALAAQNVLFEAAIDSMPSGLSMFDADLRLLVCNRAYREIYDVPPELTRPGTSLEAILKYREASGAVLDESPAFVDTVVKTLEGGGHRVNLFRLPGGRIIRVTQLRIPHGGHLATHEDITLDIERIKTLHENQEKLANQNLRFEAAVNNMSQGLCMFDNAEQLVICNAAYGRIYQLPGELMQPGTPLADILAYRFAHGMLPLDGPDQHKQDLSTMVTERVFATDVIELEDGRAISIRYHPIADGGWVATHEDITEQRHNEARIRHLARHDALTDLPNRIYFREEMEKAEGRIARGEMAAVLCVDLDYFKAVNDLQGHAVGDQVLAEVAVRLREAVRVTDLVARLGGDEFAVLMVGLDSANEAPLVAGRIVKLLSDPILVAGLEIHIGASVGIAIAPTDGTSTDTLLKNADIALYRSKSEGRANYHFFEPGMDHALQQRRAIEQGLKLALGRDELRLVFQPLVNLADNRICCLEALLRWDHPVRGVVSPLEFIPIAEETGMIVPIGEWVLRQACKAAADWPEDVHIAVNLSPVQFKNRALFNQVTSALQEAGIAPERLELEITESLMLANSAVTLETLHRLRAIGVRFSMDDFGTGYSSLSYLRSFPFDKIKIDRSLMSGQTPGPDTVAIIKAVIGLGQSLGMATTAEGIETEDQLAAVRAQGCNEVQGFLFSPPLPASGIPALLDAWRKPSRRRRGAKPAATGTDAAGPTVKRTRRKA